MHLIALTIDVRHDLLLIGDTGLFLLDETVSDAFDLCTDWVEGVVVILDAVLLFLLDCCLEFIPVCSALIRKSGTKKRFNQ